MTQTKINSQINRIQIQIETLFEGIERGSLNTNQILNRLDRIYSQLEIIQKTPNETINRPHNPLTRIML